MTHLIEVSFKGNRRDFFLWEQDEPPALKSAVIVDADRGEDLGYVHALGDLAEKRNAGTPHGYGAAGTSKVARRLATADEVDRARELSDLNEDARRRSMERVKANDLVMKVSDAEWQWDRKKLTLYFTAERRVDFRTLVRELASMFRTRIELKQIGVRDEAKRLDGIGRCGRQYCSASWLPELRPVNLGVAKDQRLSLNPSQISGACGRLMCCLRYEHDFYVQSRKRFPKEGKILRTKRGEEKLISNDIFRDRVTLRGEDGEFRTILLTELREETASVGLTSAAVTPGAPDEDDEHEHDDHGHSHSDELQLEPDIPDIIVRESIILIDPEPERSAPASGTVVMKTSEADTDTDQDPDSADGAVDDQAIEGQAVDADGRERRPHRRRGRRGGRRNRPGGRAPRDESSGGVPEGGES